jgi:hypothetical protein
MRGGGRASWRKASRARGSLAILACLALLVAGWTDPGRPDPPEPQRDPEVIVRMKDGQRLPGILQSRSDDALVVRIGGVPTTILLRDVADIDVLPPVAQRHAAMREAVGRGDVPGLLQLARWALERERYDLALADVDDALTIRPGDPDALALRRLVVSLAELRTRVVAAPDPVAGRRTVPAPPDDAFPLLAPEQINLIKVYEVDLDRPPRMSIARDSVEALMRRYADSPLIPASREGREAFIRQPASRILDTMFRLRAREFYGHVRVDGQPRSVELFRNNVHRAVLNSCATSRCHGGLEAGRLVLHTRRPGSDQTVYTNLFILDQYRLADGTSLLDYDQPERSPLVQFSLPRMDANRPHPPVLGPGGRGDAFRPLFSSARDRGYARMLAWIGAMYTPRPDYPIDYTPLRPFVSPPPGPVADGAPPDPAAPPQPR